MKLKIAAIVGLIVVGAGAVAVVVAPRSGSTDATYLTATVERGDVTDEVAATGSVGPTASYGLAFGAPARLITDASSAPSSQTTWPVSDVSVAVGDRVSRDQMLAKADTTDLQTELDIATADWRAAGNDLSLAKDALETAEDDGTTDEIRRARSGYYGAQSRYDQARQKRADLIATIAGAEIRSPIDGIVTTVDIVAGADAPSGDAIVVAAQTMAVETAVVEDDVTSLSVGQSATVTIGAIGGDVAGTVTSIGLAASDASQTGIVSYPVTVAIDEAPATLRQGMTADVTIVTATATDVLSVPTAALNGGLGAYTVQVMGDDGVPVSRPVTVGLVTDSRTEITDGLAEGEVVVTGTLNERQGIFGGGGGFVGTGGGPGRTVQIERPGGGD
jgi:macrolide-specific efflux system membrane fusion protein